MIDFHAHLDLYPEPRAVVDECTRRGTYVLSVTTTPSAWKGTMALATDAPRIRTALGLHPQLAHERESELSLFEQLVSGTSYIGEIGLDGAPEFKAHWNAQQRVFTRILELCEKIGGRIMSIHSRRAATAILDAIEVRRGAGTPILHWFSGTQRELARAIELGCWFSVGPAMMAGEKGRLLVSKMPRDRVLTETDGPFAQSGGRPLFPWEADKAIALLANEWSVSAETVEHQTRSNLQKLATLSANRS